ncbi:MAG: type II toxin-antitoxin system VapC family toxin [Alphaproteobacteria bacterium]|jgi:ribonuclease VapC|nr:type II toxin-antitoxin system VapC family toxin [Candidatus Jidaibacter sp.]
MKPIVLDASAVLALINNETGAANVENVLSTAVVSSVNLAEIVSILSTRHKVPAQQVKLLMTQLIGSVINFTEEHAYIVAKIEEVNIENKYSLSLGDKACIALGIALNATIYTADKIWGTLDMPNVNVHLIR